MDVSEIVSAFTGSSATVALGPSSLESIANEELWPRESYSIAVPDTLLRLVLLISEGSTEHRAFLIRLIRFFRTRGRSWHGRIDDDDIVDKLVKLLLELRTTNRLLVISDEMVISEIQESLARLYPGRAFEISLSPRKNFLRDYIVKIYSWSKRTGGAVLERTRRVFSDMGHHIATLQLPDRLDHFVNLKSRYTGHIHDFRGGRAAKFFVGAALSLAGFAHPAAGVAGVLIAFMDP
jgi:hypothetical protein